MDRRNIAEVIRQELHTFATLGIPEPEQGKRWQRFECPYCHGDRASISYELGIFQCFHADCRRRISVGGHGSWSVQRFRPQINQAVRNIISKFPLLLADKMIEGTKKKDTNNREEAEFWAMRRVAVYAGEVKPDGKDSDYDQLVNWEDQVKGNPDQLDRFVLQALNRDMVDWAKSKLGYIKRRHETNLLDEDENISPDLTTTGGIGANKGTRTVADSSPDTGKLEDFPLLAMRHGEGMTEQQMARKLGVSLKTIKRRIAEELERFREIHDLAA
jgi:hypothetical protein